MANDYSADSSCLAWWRFESGALTSDSKGANTLTASGTPPTSDTVNYFEGSGSAAFVKASNMYYTIADASLPATFPFKNGGQAGGTFVVRFRPTVAQIQTIFHKLTGNFGVRFYTTATSLIFTTGNGTSLTATTLFNYTSFLNNWFTAIIVIGNPGAVRIKVWNETAGTIPYDNTFVPANQAVAANVAFFIGATSSGTDAFSGNIDDFVVFNRALSIAEMDELRAATFPVTYSGAAIPSYGNANNFSSDPWCVGVYNFESGALGTDASSAANNLTLGSTFQEPLSAADYVQGSCAAEFVTPGGRYAAITDANMSAGHPLKSTGPVRNECTISCWVKFTSFTTIQWVWAKYDTTGNSRAIGIYTVASTGVLTVNYGYSTSSVVTYSTGWTPKLNRWYHITLSVIGVTGYGRLDLRAWDGERQKMAFADRYFTGQVWTQIAAAPMTVVCRWANTIGSEFLDGRIDELVVWSRVLSPEEVKKRTAAYGTIPRSQSELDLRQAAMTPPPPGKILDGIKISFYKA